MSYDLERAVVRALVELAQENGRLRAELEAKERVDYEETAKHVRAISDIMEEDAP